MYGAGEVTEILLQTLKANNHINIDIVGIIDDDKNKQNKSILGVKVHSNKKIKEINNDGILVSTYSKKEKIIERLKNINYPEDRILHFFR